MLSRLYRLFVLIIVGLGVLPAAAGPGDVFDAVSASGACDDLTLIYSVGDDYGVQWWLTDSDKNPVASGSFGPEKNAESVSESLDLSGLVMVGGETYTMTFDWGEGKGYDDLTFTAGPCATASTGADSSSQYVELPPCKLSDNRLDDNCSAFVVTYSQMLETGCYINIYSPYGRADGTTVRLLQATPEEIAAAQSQGGNAVIDSTDVVNLTNVTLYWLPETNEFQVNAGPNAEGKVYVLNFTGCPATNIYTTNSYQKAQ